MKVIALSGYKGSGKDTVATMLSEYNYQRFSFADALKNQVAKQYDIDRTWLDDVNYKEKPLLRFPVNPTDKFAENIVNFMLGEFRDVNGFSISDSECQPDLFWTPRALDILEGNAKRAANKDYWVNQIIDKINTSGCEYVVITDCRYKSEITSLREAFGDNLTTVEVRRYADVASSDPSERDLEGVERDIIINNTKDLDNLLLEVTNKLHLGK